MAHERDPYASFDTPSTTPFTAGETFSVEAVRHALEGPPGERRKLAEWLLERVDREVRIALRPIASRYRRDLRDVAEDIVQDVLMLLFYDGGRVLRTWDPERGMLLRSFLSLVVRRYIYRRFRGFRGNPWSVEPRLEADLVAQLDDGITTNPSLLADIEYRLHLDVILGKLHSELSERDWRLFTKLYVEQRKPSDVGEEEGMRENSIHKWCSRFQQRVPQIFASARASGV